MSKDKTLWEQWVAQLSPEAQQALAGKPVVVLPLDKASVPFDADEAGAYEALLTALSPEASQALQAAAQQPEVKPEEEYDDTLARYGLVECPDGDWGAMRLFKRVEGLAARVGQLEGEDVVLWAFFGLPIYLTKGPQRYLLLPNSKAIMVPMYEGGPCKLVDASLLEGVDIQEDGYVGPPELANSKLVHAKLEGSEGKKTTATGGAGDDDDDADDDKETSID